MPTSLRSASSFVVIPPPPAVVSRGDGGRALGHGRRRAPHRPSGDEVVAPMTPSSSLRSSMLFGVGREGAPTSRLVLPRSRALTATRRMLPPIRQRLPHVSRCPSLVVNVLNQQMKRVLIQSVSASPCDLNRHRTTTPPLPTPAPSRSRSFVESTAAPFPHGGVSPCDTCVGSVAGTGRVPRPRSP
jgi:hypothetical protein